VNRKQMRKMNKLQKPQQININPDDTTPVACECGHDVFNNQGVRVRKVSAIMSPNGQEMYITTGAPYCVKCGVALPGKP